ncbi:MULTISPECIES: GGDEF domain-containing response regulator [Vibrio]|uniref:GGDEF domain-containing response regulator n=1 Tax=Vibrio TaxID=662 RepID=UPI00207559F3|nr:MULTISPECIES: diguanylate cyclase [Vibrio]USD35343.1 diguanylate cyclase [Vibrio sp. SCSIO 43186]USD48409.1 diguanylate cyclase [Vibrio sp. SCSIO 43145]USD72468.1 diguanylate cyclase [Vibrio sp. SCSIO 43139]USD98144.1 diguanylate cyclase response regulator [Vibrio coralliilyticus]
MKILLVDDVQMERMQLAIRLKQLGHTVEMAESGEQALEMYPTFEPELILLDISMPEMDGFEVSKRIRSIYKEWIPIIFLSSHDEPTMIANAIEAGGDDYLTKPVDKLVLASKLIAMQRIAFMRRELNQKTAELAKVNQELEKLASEDGLTKVKNRRYIDEKLKEMIAVHGRHSLPLSLILLDVDHFKLYNDNYGHIEGDKCLIEIAQALDSLFSRSGEIVGRYGGEEFVIVLGHTDAEHAQQHARRIQSTLETLAIKHEYSLVSDYVTVSQGVCSFTPKGSEIPDVMYSKADEGLYKSKSEGRNRFSYIE